MPKNIYELYHGFYIEEPVGNNAFSFAKRKNKKIFVPPLIQGALSDLLPGDKIVFSEIDDGEEYNKTGLKNFVHLSQREKDIFIFDNHNHAFFFWLWGWNQGKIERDTILVHIDQHTDMRRPNVPFSVKADKELNLQDVFRYTNYELNVGNFIQPAVDVGLISRVETIDSSSGLEKEIPQKFVLDMDMDIFAPDLDYMDNNRKLAKIRSYINQSSFITIATSPYFIDQDRAIQFVHELFKAYT